jgi:tRNA(Leu) C34 or U34 (ribose-2'-O)-methylase TrmL
VLLFGGESHGLPEGVVTRAGDELDHADWLNARLVE